MKKSNVIILAILVICSIILLWLWFYLGFNHVDDPVDLVVSIIWWVVIVAVGAVIAHAESLRRRAIRTVFVAPTNIFNSEKGLSAISGSATDTIQKTLENLEYNFEKQDLPEDSKALFTHAVKSSTFKKASQGNSVDWQGEVVVLQTGETRQFGNASELQAILGA